LAAWLAHLRASAFNSLGQYGSSPGNGLLLRITSSLLMVVTIGSTHCAYPWKDGQAEWAWVAG